MPQVRVFASFDINRDEDLFKRLMKDGKKAGAPYEVFDRSTRESPTPEAAERLRERIARVDALVVLCGEWTHRATNVSCEVKLAQELGKRYYLLKGRRFRECSRPASARIDDPLYQWSNGVLDDLVFRFR